MRPRFALEHVVKTAPTRASRQPDTDSREDCDRVLAVFDPLGVRSDSLTPYKDAQDFAIRFRRCDRQEYAHTRYALTTSANE